MDKCYTDWLHPLMDFGSCRAAYTSRGNVSGGALSDYDGFNLCHYTGDDPAHISYCRQLLSSLTGVAENHIIVPTQTHSAKAVEITAVPADGYFEEECDGLVTALKSVIIGVNTADCVPVVLLDAVNLIVGVAHAGWRGALGGIVTNTLDLMLKAGATAGDIHFDFGPSICVDCFEVGEEVASQFPSAFVVRRADWERPHVDLQNFIRYQLMTRGVIAEERTCRPAGMCTKHSPDRFFSARAIGQRSGRDFTFAWII